MAIQPTFLRMADVRVDKMRKRDGCLPATPGLAEACRNFRKADRTPPVGARGWRDSSG